MEVIWTTALVWLTWTFLPIAFGLMLFGLFLIYVERQKVKADKRMEKLRRERRLMEDE